MSHGAWLTSASQESPRPWATSWEVSEPDSMPSIGTSPIAARMFDTGPWPKPAITWPTRVCWPVSWSKRSRPPSRPSSTGRSVARPSAAVPRSVEDAAPIATATVRATTSRRRCMGKLRPSRPPQSSVRLAFVHVHGAGARGRQGRLVRGRTPSRRVDDRRVRRRLRRDRRRLPDRGRRRSQHARVRRGARDARPHDARCARAR